LFDQILIFTDEFKDKCVLTVAYPQRRCIFLLGCDSAAASVSAVALFNFKIKLPGNRRFINTNKINSYVDKAETAVLVMFSQYRAFIYAQSLKHSYACI
jgi:hypothetical protein